MHPLAKMLALVQDTPDKKEAGGVILGRHILDSTDIVVDEITTVMKGDTQGRFHFRRRRRRHQQAIDKFWQDSKGTCTYLGEWHTHPEPHPTPSFVDLNNWKRKLREDVFAGENLYFIILGVETMRVWEGCRTGTICQLIGEFPLRRIHNVENKDSP
ncbi:MAG: Mov34/MPN/PAD-1 family protein [Desulfuromonadaceae bacterium]|nr:Mov34/MPN/PAD-1 family protein [Desulfuromonadaceae bacterium]